jgi:hypothetical protein
MVAASSQFRLYTGSIAALSIPNTGNVLINTTTDAGYKLDVNGTARVQGNIYLTDQANRYIYGFGGSYIKFYDSGTGGLDIYNLNGTSATRNYGPLQVYGNFTTTGSFSMNGNLNIGNGNFLAADASTYNRIYPYNGANGNMRFILGHPTVGDFDWEYPINTVLVRLKRNGNFLIGTTTDAGYKLDVNGTIRSNNAIYASQYRLTAYPTYPLLYNSGSTIILEPPTSAGSLNFIIGSSGTVTINGSAGGFNNAVNLLALNRTYTSAAGLGTAHGIKLDITFNETGGAKSYVGYFANYIETSFLGTTGNLIQLQRDSIDRFIVNRNGQSFLPTLTNATKTDQVYYDSATGELTYGSLPVVATPTLAQVTTAGNTTTNEITVNNVVIGGGAGGSNTFIGQSITSRSLGTLDENTFVGFAAGANFTGNSNGNTALGWLSLNGAANNVEYNTAIGARALSLNTSQYNTGLGYSAGYNNTSGSQNVYIGYNAGLGITTGSNNTIVGASITGLASNLANTLILGAANSIRIYSPSTGNVLINTTTDAGYKLDVNGTARIQGNTTITGASGILITTSGAGLNASGATTAIVSYAQNGAAVGYTFTLANQYGGVNVNKNFFAIGDNFFLKSAFATGTNTVNWFGVYPDIINTGGTTISRGIYYNPTLTSLTGTTHRAIETTSGDVIFNGGNVGIGTTTPTDIFHIVNNTTGNKFARISAGAADASAAWVAQNDQVDNVVYRVFGSGVSGTQMGIALARSASLLANLGGSGKFLLGTYSNTDFVMGTGNSEKMRIVDSTGNVLIATTTDLGNKLEVSGAVNATTYKINNIAGYTGILNIPLNPPGMQNVDIQSGIIVNIF